MWKVGPPGRTVVAVDEDGAVAGTANMYANRVGGGSHVASGSFIVDPSRWGKGAGRALGEEVIAWARKASFRAIGFEIVRTVPEAFRHPVDGYVGLHVMYRRV